MIVLAIIGIFLCGALAGACGAALLIGKLLGDDR